MDHWSTRFVGLPVSTAFDCADLAQLVQREVFGREVAVPGERWYRSQAGAARLRATAAQLSAVKDQLALRTTRPCDGDAVLMRQGSGEARRMLHVGLYCRLAGEPWVLHAADATRQVVRTRVRMLSLFGLALEGYYQWA